MLSCEEATYLSTKKIIEGVNRHENRSLQMHLAVCKHCRKHYFQVKLLTRNIRHFASKGLNGSPVHRMSPSEKSKLQRLISNKIRSN